MLIFIGAPVFYLELTLGQFTSAGPLVVWKVNPLLRGLLIIHKKLNNEKRSDIIPTTRTIEKIVHCLSLTPNLQIVYNHLLYLSVNILQ